jgi:hypothetical protein
MGLTMKKLTVLKKTFQHDVVPVYDIEVAGENHYLIGANAIASHNSGFLFASSIVVSMNKRKLKEDEHGNKITDVAGIRAKIKCVKTRYAKPFEEVELHIPYASGMSRYSGLFDLFEKTVFVKDGNRYKYVSKDGTEHKLFRKAMTPEFFDMVMAEWQDDKSGPAVNVEVDEIEQEPENVE